MPEENKKYDASDITVLEGLEAVRRRPGMYIGTTGLDGLYHLIWETFDNSRDEAMGGFANHIEIALLPNNSIRVVDNGRGIPVDMHAKTKVSALETILTTLHAGGKFGGEGYKVSGGLHGVGISVVNALSTDIYVEVHRDKEIYFQEYKNQKPLKKISTIGKTNQTGTVIIFTPDSNIFKEIDFSKDVFSMERIIDRVRDQSYLVKGLKIDILDLRNKKFNNTNELFISKNYPSAKSYSLFFEGGLKSFIKYYNNGLKTIHDDIFYIEKKVGNVNVGVSLQYIDDISSRLFAYGNNIKNTEGGTHVTGFKSALTKVINQYSKAKKILKPGDSFTGDDVIEGVTAIVSVQLPEIQFEGQTKSKLGSTEARTAVESVFFESFSTFLEENPNIARQIMSKINLALQARKAARAAKDSVLRKGALESSQLPGKLTDCQVKNSDEAELFIVEGESAGGTARSGRDRRTQAILPIKGKILNVERVRIDKVLQSEEIKTLITAIGTSIGDTFNIEKLRYGKIIIATDADVDGAHIRTLLLTLFYRYFKDLIKEGNIYFAQPPLYKIKKGKESIYLYSDDEKNKMLAKLTKGDKNAEAGIFVQRYKGLGEMNADELSETTMNINNRILKQVTYKDAAEADKVFDVLMGNDVSPRRAFIQENARYANIDI